MKILVTGAAGFIASHLAEALTHAGHEVIGLDSFTDYYDRQQKDYNAAAVRASGAHLFEVDLASDDLAPYTDGVEVVYHVAAQPGISATTPFADYQRNNIEATYRLLEAVKTQRSLGLFVNVGTSSIYGLKATEPETAAPEPVSHYGVTKLTAEQMVLAYQRSQGLPACSLRLFSVYGPRERPDKLYPRLIRSILQGVPFPLFANSRDHSRSFTYVGDVIQGFMRVLNTENAIGEIINIGSDVEMKTGEAIDMVESLLGKPGKFDLKPARPGDQEKTHANIDKARRLLGFEPQTTFREGIQQEILWMQDFLGVKS